MKVSFSKENMLYGIQKVDKAVSNKTTLPILTGICFETVDNSTLKLSATDLEIGIECSIKCNVEKPGAVVLSASMFSEIIKKLPEQEISLEVTDNHKAKITCGNSYFNISGSSIEDFPKLPEIKQEKVIKISQGLFKDMIKQTIFAVSTDETRHVLMGELLEINNDSLKLVALDGYRIAIREGKGEDALNIERDIIIPGKTLNEFGKILSSNTDDYFTVSLTDNQIMFDLGDTIVVSRLLDGEFVNYEQVIPQEFNTVVKVNRNGIINSIDRAYLVAREGKGNNLIKIEIRDGVINITSNSEIGEVKEQVEAEVSGEDLVIAFNSKYIMDALKATDSDEVVMQFINEVNPCVIKPMDVNNQLNLVLPVKIR